MAAAAPRALRVLLLLAVAGYGASLFTRPFACAYGEGMRGYEVLLVGWIGPLVLDPRWYANLLAPWLVSSAWRSRRTKYTVCGALVMLALVAASPLPALGCAGDPGTAGLSLGLQGGGYLWALSLALVAGCALRRPVRREGGDPLPAPGSGRVGEAVRAALRDFGNGQPAHTRCPRCTVLVMVKADAAPAAPGSARVATSCACGACDGSYELPERP